MRPQTSELLREWGLECGLVPLLFAPAAQDLLSRVDVAGRRVLDVGCGSGIVARLARLGGASYVKGVDLCVDAVQVAKTVAPYPGVDFARFDLARDDLGELGTFDVIVAAHVVEQIGTAMLANVASCLAPGGHLVASAWWNGVGLARCPAYELIYTATGLAEGYDTEFAKPPEQLREAASALKVEVLEVSQVSTRPMDTAGRLVSAFLAGTTFGQKRTWAEHEAVMERAKPLVARIDASQGVPMCQAVLIARKPNAE